MGVNLAGVEIVMKLLDRLRQSDEELKRLRADYERLKAAH